MPFCKNCRREFDYKPGQSTPPMLDMKYCSEKCWYESREFERKIKNFRCMLKKIPLKQRIRFLKIFVDKDFDDYELEYSKIIWDFCSKHKIKIWNKINYKNARTKKI